MIILAFQVLFRIIIIGQVVFEFYYIWSLVFLVIVASTVFLGVQLSVSGLSLSSWLLPVWFCQSLFFTLVLLQVPHVSVVWVQLCLLTFMFPFPCAYPRLQCKQGWMPCLHAVFRLDLWSGATSVKARFSDSFRWILSSLHLGHLYS